MRFLKSLIGAAALVLISNAASAALIDGEMSFIGGYTPDTPTLSAETTTINFGSTIVGGVSGDFAAFVSNGDAVTMSTPFVFDPFVGPIMDFWQVGGFSFTLENIISVTFTDIGLPSLTIVGKGTASGNGFDETDGTYIFTGNSSGQTFTYSASTKTEVPEPATLLLLGGGLVGLGAVARRRQARAAA